MGQAEGDRVEISCGTLFADRYWIEDVIGRGGMGAVYRARDVTLGETIALKLLVAGSDATAAQVARFRQEVRLARRVTHPNVARVYDIGEHAQLVYLTMELIEGETLRVHLKRHGALPRDRAVGIALALCDGLDAAHAAGVVHRDLKPGNVLLTDRGRVVITDFGIARSVADSSGFTEGALGTPLYMAPEQLVSGAIDRRTDIYALGLVLYEMLAGERLAGVPRPGLLDPELDALVRACTAPVADARPASVQEVASVLASVATQGGARGSSGGASTVEPASPLSRRLEVPPPRASSTGLHAREADTRQLGAPRPTATLATQGRALAVLPFRYRGPKEQEYFGDAITDELVDVLARTRGMRVLGTGATARYIDARDPRVIGVELGASAVIDGTAQLAGDRMRITVRLLEAASGVQIWSERYDTDLGDLFAVQEGIAQRVAEELRVELTVISHRTAVPAEAIEMYLSSRHRLRAFDFAGAAVAVKNLERSLELAPDFPPALAAHAIACLRCWFFDVDSGPTDWGAASRASVARALARAADLAETHLASAILATQGGDYRTGAQGVARALSIAPTYADAHEYLGMLQCEAGRAEEGGKRLKLAHTLDPTLAYAPIFLARLHELRGEWAKARAIVDDVERRHGPALASLIRAQRIRAAGWRRDREELKRWALDHANDDTPNWRVVRLYARALSSDVPAAELREGIAHVLGASQNPRFVSLTEQLATEIYAGLGQIEEARFHLLRAATSVLVDMEWLDRCPLLAELRAVPDWADARRRVQARAEAVWRA